MTKEEIENIEERLDDLEDEQISFLNVNVIIFLWIFCIGAILFLTSMMFGNYYTEEVEFNYTCYEIEKMIVLDEFDKGYKGQKYLDTFWRKRLKDGDAHYTEKDFRDYYLVNCLERKPDITTATVTYLVKDIIELENLSKKKVNRINKMVEKINEK